MDDETTVVKKTVIESTETGSGTIDPESTIGKTSVRGWIALISVLAISVSLIMILVALICGKLPVDSISVSIIITITGLLSNLVATYIGQGQKPK